MREGEAPAEPIHSQDQSDARGSAGALPSHTSFAHRVETPQAWKVPVEQIIAAGYNLDIKNPHDSGEDNADPDGLLADYQRQLTDLQQTRDRLKAELMEVLQGSREGAKTRR